MWGISWGVSWGCILGGILGVSWGIRDDEWGVKTTSEKDRKRNSLWGTKKGSFGSLSAAQVFLHRALFKPKSPM